MLAARTVELAAEPGFFGVSERRRRDPLKVGTRRQRRTSSQDGGDQYGKRAAEAAADHHGRLPVFLAAVVGLFAALALA
jgi:hypothetical protein